MAPVLRVVNYHYVRDLPRTRYPRIKGLLWSAFVEQVQALKKRYDMATLEQADAFLRGDYQPQRDICLLTFDDGLKEHYREITPWLAEHKIQGLFFLTTACIEDAVVLSVHKNHFLMASLEFAEYRDAFARHLTRLSPESSMEADQVKANATYRFDTPEVAALKYLLNFKLPVTLREQVLNALFAEYLGDEQTFARELYVTWEEAHAMQAAGMVLGGHSHRHVALASLGPQGQQVDLELSTRLLKTRLQPQPLWPFSYPYGNPVASFNEDTIRILQNLEYCCAFTTQVNVNLPQQDRFQINRFDTVDIKL